MTCFVEVRNQQHGVCLALQWQAKYCLGIPKHVAILHKLAFEVCSNVLWATFGDLYTRELAAVQWWRGSGYAATGGGAVVTCSCGYEVAIQSLFGTMFMLLC